MGYDIAANVRKCSKHDGNPYFVLMTLAVPADDFDRTITLYMDTLAAYCHMDTRMLQRAVRHLESSGELVVYSKLRPKTQPREACLFQLPILPIEWPDSYRIDGLLIDRRKRPIWTDDMERQRRAIHRHNEAIIRSQRAENRQQRKARSK